MVRDVLPILLAACIAAPYAAQQPASMPAAPTVDDAIDRGVAWLLRSQEPDGSWPGPEPGIYRGMTAFAAYTLVKCDRRPDHPAVRAAVAQVAAAPIQKTYDAAASLLLLHALGDSRPKGLVKTAADRLVATISNGKRMRGSQWGYPNDHGGTDDRHTDLSNTQYAILGLRAARLSGYEAGGSQFWATVARDMIAAQGPYGGFGYERGQDASASMTVAGLTVLDVCEEALGAAIDVNLRNEIREAMDKGFGWLGAHWSVDHMIDLRFKEQTNDRWLEAYLYGLERLGAFIEKDVIAGHDWYAEGSKRLLRTQKAIGQWGSGDADTCFGLLFLRRGSRTSGLPPRAAREQSAGADAAFAIAMDDENPRRAWIRSIGNDLRARLDAGARIATLTWLVDGVEATHVDDVAANGLSEERSHLRHAFRSNGAHTIAARLTLAGAGGSFASNVLACPIDAVEEAWHREAIADQGKNLVPAARAVWTASSDLDAARAASGAGDGCYGTSWVASRRETAPWIKAVFPGGIRASVVKLSSASWPGDKDDIYARPCDVEIAVNGGDPVVVRLEDTVRRKQSVRITGSPIRSLQIRITSVYGGTAEPNAAGFKEIELFDAPAELPADWFAPARRAEAVVPTAREGSTRWRYTFDAPPDRWAAVDFDDAFWKEGAAGFGTAPNTLPPPRTPWKTRDIWIRRVFTLPPGPGELAVAVNHDDDAEVWINGALAVTLPSYSMGGYVWRPLSSAARAALVVGRNVIAVHCRNPAGVGYVDAGLVRLVPSE